jgi:multiple sugar transport system substrate-binding protein
MILPDPVRLRSRGTLSLAMCLAFLIGTSCVPQESDRQIVLRVSNWSGAGDNESEYDKLVQEFYRQFEKENPGVRVRIEGIPGEYVQKMLLNFVAGTEPDVVTLDASSAAIFINNGFLRDLTPFIHKDPEFKLTDYYPNVVDIARRGNALYAVPGDFTPMVVYYNKRLFDQAGVPYPKPGWSFEDFLQTSKRLTVPGKQYGFSFANWMPGWIMWLWNNGGDVLTPDGKRASGVLDSPQNVQTISFLRDLVKVHKVSPSLSEAASLGVDLFANGQSAMTVSGHWSLSGYKNAPKGPDGKPKIDWKELGVVSMPHNTPKSNTVMYEAGFGITKGSKHPDLAWKFLKMWTGYKLQHLYNQSGIAVSARKDVSAERMVDPIERQFVSIIPTARPPYGSRIEGYEIVEKMGKNAVDSILNNDVPVLQALKQAATRIDQEFAKK